MRIGIDARFFGPIGKGLGRYTERLIENLEGIVSEHAPQARGEGREPLEFIVFLRRTSSVPAQITQSARFWLILRGIRGPNSCSFRHCFEGRGSISCTFRISTFRS
jgi:hypothetical protein